MPLGTLDRTPPPFFRQGTSALTKLVFFSALAVFLMVSDSRFGFIEPMRSVLATVLLPLQRAAALPHQLFESLTKHMGGLQAAVADERAAKAALVQQAERTVLADQLALENARLRALLELRSAQMPKSIAAEVTHAAADPFSRKVVVDKGMAHGVQLGSAVINEVGFLGQITRSYPLTSEVTLLIDRDAAIPVINQRTQQRSAAFGGAAGGAEPSLELRYLAANADVQVGDTLVTSGLDEFFPAGLPVARVAVVERRSDTGFASIRLLPLVQADGVRHLLILEPRGRANSASGVGKRPAEGLSSAANATPAPAASTASAAISASGIR
jgi:rod shape-determining protein MreC